MNKDEDDGGISCFLWIVILIGSVFLCNAIWGEIIKFITTNL